MCMQKLNLNTDEFETIVNTAGHGWEAVCSHDGSRLVTGGNLAGLAIFSRCLFTFSRGRVLIQSTMLIARLSVASELLYYVVRYADIGMLHDLVGTSGSS